MPGPVAMAGDAVCLHTIEEEDLAFLQRGRNHPDVRRPLTDVDPMNADAIEEYFENGVSGDDDGFGFLVCRAEDEEPVGAVHVPWIRTKHGSGMLMYWVAPDHQGNGYVTEATELVLEFAFRERRLAKVYAVVLETNVASQRVLENIGFEREGVHRQETFVDGERRDNYRYGILADEWLDRSAD